jgi:alpha-L-arabinofuranosidase
MGRSDCQRVSNRLASREGASPSDRWKWNETIGPVEDRPGREGESYFFCVIGQEVSLIDLAGDWGYPNTDALGT